MGYPYCEKCGINIHCDVQPHQCPTVIPHAPVTGLLPKDYEARKALPIFDVLTRYFPDAWVAVTRVSVAGNVQHNPGEPLHWARGKSMDQFNTALRHMMDHASGKMYDEEPPEVLAALGGESTRHLAKAAWRILAALQLSIEASRDPGRESQIASGQPVEGPQGVLPQARAKRNGGSRARLSRKPSRNRVRH